MSVASCTGGRLLSRAEAAALLGVAPGTLAHWAAAGTGPAFSRSGPVRGRVWYAEADVVAWVQGRRQIPAAAGLDTGAPPKGRGWVAGVSDENQNASKKGGGRDGGHEKPSAVFHAAKGTKS